jgi:hypothetical protein
MSIAGAGPGTARPIRYTTLKSENALYHAVIADMASGQVKAEALFEPKLTKFWSFITKSQPAAAITGTFFAWETGMPVADVIVDGVQKGSGHVGSVIAVDWYGKVHIFDSEHKKQLDWFPYRHALRGTIRVVTNGKVNPNPKAQKFKDRGLWGRAARTAIGTTRDDHLVMLATKKSVTLSELGRAMTELGVTNGISLDGGGSTMLYYRGAQVVPTGRKLSSMFVLHERSPIDNDFRDHMKRIARNQRRGALGGVLSLGQQR